MTILHAFDIRKLMCEIFGRHAVIIRALVDKRTVYADQDENGDQFKNKKQAQAFAQRKFSGEKVSIYSVKVTKPVLK